MEKKEKKKIIETDKIVNIKIENKDQIISTFSYDENDKLNEDLSDFITYKTTNLQPSQHVKLNFYSKTPLEEKEIKQTIKNHYQEECEQVKSELKRSNVFILVMFIFGLVTLAISVALHNLGFKNFYFEMILEIASWVFIWEAVDRVFIARPKVRRRHIQMQKIIDADVKVILSTNDESNQQDSPNIKNERKN